MTTKTKEGNNATELLLTAAQYELISKKIFNKDLDSQLTDYELIFNFLNKKKGYILIAYNDCLSEKVRKNIKPNQSPLIESFDFETFYYAIEELDVLEQLHHLIALKFIASIKLEKSTTYWVYGKKYIDEMISFIKRNNLSNVVETLTTYRMYLDNADGDKENEIEIAESITSIITSFVSVLESLILEK